MICECGWKHDADSCPQCGAVAKEEDEGVMQWNSTLKVRSGLTSKKRPNPISKKRKEKGRSQAEAMESVAMRNDPVCIHCGMPIDYWKYSNIDHIKPKGKYPELIDDPKNMQVLCDNIDVQIYTDRNKVTDEVMKLLNKGGCHHVKQNQPKAVWHQKKGLIK